MGEITTIGLDIGKRIFVAHGADACRRGVLRKRLCREEVYAFFASLPPCLVGMEACARPPITGRRDRGAGA
jgi:transposase